MTRFVVEKKSIPMTQGQAAKRWMEWQMGSLRNHFESQGYNNETINEIYNFMTPEIKQWAKWQLDFYKAYKGEINPVHQKLFYTDMDSIEGYSPIKRLNNSGKEDSNLLKQESAYSSVVPGGIKRRVENNREIVLQDCDDALLKHIAEMEHFKAWGEPMRELRSVLGSDTVRTAITQYHGTGALSVLDGFLNDFARGRTEPSTRRDKLFEKLRGAITTAAVGLNTVVFGKQLTSIPAYAVEIPAVEWARYIPRTPMEIAHAHNFLMKNSKMMQSRYTSGFDRDMAVAMRGNTAKTMSGVKTLADRLMFFTKAGDKAAIVMGGWSVYKYHYAQQIKAGKSKVEAQSLAIREFEKATERSQQATGLKDLSVYQRGGTYERLFTMFITSPMQYYRHTSAAVREMTREGGDKKKAAKRLFIFNFVLPCFFQFASGPGGNDWDDYVRAILLGPLNGIPVLRDAGSCLLNTLTGEPVYGSPGTPPVFDGIEDAKKLYTAAKKYAERPMDAWVLDRDFWHVIESGGRFVGSATGLPVKPSMRWAEGVHDAVTGETTAPIRRAWGYRENAVDPSEGDYTELRKEIKQAAKYGKRGERYSAMLVMEKRRKILDKKIEKMKEDGASRAEIREIYDRKKAFYERFVERWK